MKKYLVKFTFDSREDTYSSVSLVRPDEFGDATIDVYKVADETWAKENFPNVDLKGMSLNNKWEVQLKGGK